MAKLELSKTKCKLAACEATEVLSRTWREVQVLFQGFESNMSSGVVSPVSRDGSGKYQELSLCPCFSKQSKLNLTHKTQFPPSPCPFPFPCFICLAVASRDQTVGTVQSAPFSGAQAPDQNLLALFAAGMITSKKEPLLQGSDALPPAQPAGSDCRF